MRCGHAATSSGLVAVGAITLNPVPTGASSCSRTARTDGNSPLSLVEVVVMGAAARRLQVVAASTRVFC